MYDRQSDGAGEQKDLFSELIQHSDTPDSIKVKPQKRPLTITLNMDKVLVFVLTCTIVFAVIFFYGVETGKKMNGGEAGNEGTGSPAVTISAQNDVSIYELPKKAVDQGDDEVSSAKGIAPQKTEEVITLDVPEKAVAPAVEKKTERIPDSAWTIQIITYVNERYAKDEVKKIQERGFEGYVLPSGKYLQVCVGQYEDKAGAMKVLDKFKKQKDYADAYVRHLDKDKLLRIKKFQERR